MKRQIRIKFIDCFDRLPENRIFREILERNYEIVETDQPDYVLDGGLGREYVNYDCIKIVRTGENYVPDFNAFDYAIGFDHLDFGDRYLRLPIFATYPQFRELAERSPSVEDAERLLNRGFCSFVVSNDEGDPARIEFFRRLSKYKPVASGGKLFNTVGGRVADKQAFIAGYKFNIAFENSCVPGYTTEKIMEPLAARTVPIYYGNPRIDEDFDPACMVRLGSRADMDRAIEEIVALDRDDTAYLRKLAAPRNRHNADWYEQRLEAFVRRIFDQPLAEARRLSEYGYQVNIRRRMRRLWNLYEWSTPARIVKRLMRKGRS